MPRKVIDYSKTVIYKIVCNDLNVKDVYVGHTTEFTKRKATHKSHCLNPNDSKHNLKVYKMIRENGDWNNWSMIEIEKYPCKDDNEARARERFWYEELQATMNTLCPILYIGEKKQYEKDYHEKNKEKLDEYQKNYQKNYHEKNKDVINTKHKDYYVRNKDKLLEDKKEYYRKNKDYFQYKHKCECGGCFTIQYKLAHFKTLKHIKYIQEKESD